MKPLRVAWAERFDGPIDDRVADILEGSLGLRVFRLGRHDESTIGQRILADSDESIEVLVLRRVQGRPGESYVLELRSSFESDVPQHVSISRAIVKSALARLASPPLDDGRIGSGLESLENTFGLAVGSTADLTSSEALVDAGRSSVLTRLRDVVRCESLSKVYVSHDQEIVAVRDVTQAFEPRTTTCLFGPTGAGKSSLIHLLAGLDSPTSGAVYYGSVSLDTLSERELTHFRRTTVGFVFQAFNLIPTLTVRENISLPSDLAGVHADDAWVAQLASLLGLMSSLDMRPAELPGATQQRVAIARALVGRPTLVFADEPTGNLDRLSGVDVLQTMTAVAAALEQTMIIATSMPHVAAASDHVLLMARGEVLLERQGSTEAELADDLRRLET